MDLNNNNDAARNYTITRIPSVMNDEVSNIDPSCYITNNEHVVERFWLVTILGSTLSTISIVENAFLFLIFITSKQHRRSHSLYLLILALTDLFISFTYILIMSIKVLYQYNQWVFMKRIWITYVVPMMTMSHVAITASSFLIVFATVERFCITLSNHYVEILQNNRACFALVAIFIGILTKGTLLLELKPVHDPDCIGTLNEYRLELTALVIDNKHYKLFRFWFRNIVTILFPFFTLMFLNVRIVNELRKGFSTGRHHIDSIRADSAKERKARIRAATRTLVLVVCTYLLANMLNVIITIWEHTDATSLFSSFLDFYIFSVDTVSLLTIVACALRLPIYASCQPTLRTEMIHFAKNFCKRQRQQTDEQCITSSLTTHNAAISDKKINNEKQTSCDTSYLNGTLLPSANTVNSSTLHTKDIAVDSQLMSREKQNLRLALIQTLRGLQERNKKLQMAVNKSNEKDLSAVHTEP